MKKILIVILGALFVVGVSNTTWAVTCKDLDTKEKIKAFAKKSKESNPLQRENASGFLEIRTKDKGKKKKNVVHSLRVKDKRRFVFTEGQNAPVCLISTGKREFKCNECTVLTNSQCRSFKSSEKTTTIRGTNIDTEDFKLVQGENHDSKCVNIKKSPKYFKIISIKKSGDSPYDKIESFYDKKKEIPIMMKLYAKGVLRKVYRFFPKYYIQLKGQWISTVTRVRTTQGDEKKYSFETLVLVQQGKDKKYRLYLDPAKDPALRKANLSMIFRTN